MRFASGAWMPRVRPRCCSRYRFGPTHLLLKRPGRSTPFRIFSGCTIWDLPSPLRSNTKHRCSGRISGIAGRARSARCGSAGCSIATGALLRRLCVWDSGSRPGLSRRSAGGAKAEQMIRKGSACPSGRAFHLEAMSRETFAPLTHAYETQTSDARRPR